MTEDFKYKIIKKLVETNYRTVFYMMLIGHNLFKINKGQTLIR